MIVGVPCINRPDLLARFLLSVDAPAGTGAAESHAASRQGRDGGAVRLGSRPDDTASVNVVVIDNSGGEDVAAVAHRAGAECVRMPANLGVAASWNFIIRSFPAEPWWIIANADVVLGADDLDRLAQEMQQRPGPRWVGMNGDWRAFAINAECVERVGFFDENFFPIYCEDADYERRCTLAGVPWYSINGDATHDGSATIRSGYGAANARTYPANAAYFEAKWGGPVREGRFLTPFDRCGSVADWALQLARLRELAWESPA